MAKKEFKTIEEAAAAVASLEAALEAKETELKTLSVEKQELGLKIQELESKLEKEQSTAKEVISSLSVQLDTIEKRKSSKNHVVEFEKKQYEFTIPRFEFNGKVVKAVDLKKNDPLIGELLEAGFGGIKLLTPKNPKSDA